MAETATRTAANAALRNQELYKAILPSGMTLAKSSLGISAGYLELVVDRLDQGKPIDEESRPFLEKSLPGHRYVNLGVNGDTIPGRYQNIEIADCIAAPAVAAGYDDAPAVAKMTDNGLGLSFGHRELETSPCRRLFERSRYLLLDRWAEPPQLAQPSGFENTAKIVERAHLELVVQQPDPLRPEPRERRDVTELAGELLF